MGALRLAGVHYHEYPGDRGPWTVVPAGEISDHNGPTVQASVEWWVSQFTPGTPVRWGNPSASLARQGSWVVSRFGDGLTLPRLPMQGIGQQFVDDPSLPRDPLVRRSGFVNHRWSLVPRYDVPPQSEVEYFVDGQWSSSFLAARSAVARFDVAVASAGSHDGQPWGSNRLIRPGNFPPGIERIPFLEDLLLLPTFASITDSLPAAPSSLMDLPGMNSGNTRVVRVEIPADAGGQVLLSSIVGSDLSTIGYPWGIVAIGNIELVLPSYRYRAVAGGLGQSARTVIELGAGKVGLVPPQAPDATSFPVKVVDCAKPGKVLSEVSLPMIRRTGSNVGSPLSEVNLLKTSCYLGAGRNLAFFGDAYVNLGIPQQFYNGYFRTITFRDGEAAFGDHFFLNMPGSSNGLNMFVYATSGSTVKVLAGEVIDNVMRTRVATLRITPDGSISREGTWVLTDVALSGADYSHQRAPALVRDGSLYAFGDRLRRYDAETFELLAEGPERPEDVFFADGKGWGYANFAPDGWLEFYELLGESFNDIRPRLWRVHPRTLQATSRDLNLPSAGRALAEMDLRYGFPPNGIGETTFLGPLGDQRSSIGAFINGASATNSAGDPATIGLLSTSEYLGAGMDPNPFGAPGHADSSIFYTRDGYAITLDRRGTAAGTVKFWSTAPRVIPDDTAAPLGSYQQGFFS